MAEENGRFRAALGGFNRRDVAQYIEKMAKEHREQVEALQAELEQTRKEKEALAEELEGLRSHSGDLADQEAKVRASLEESTRSLSHLRGELQVTQGHLAMAKKQLGDLQGKVAQLEPMAKQYEVLKDRVATVELEAHRRAQDTVDQAMAEAEDIRAESERVHAETEQARGEAERIRTEARRWADSVLTQYSQLRRGMDSLIRQARALGQTADQMGPLDKSAQRLQKLVGLDQAKGKP